MYINKKGIIKWISILLLLLLNFTAIHAASINNISTTACSESRSVWRTLWGEPALDPTLALGMWTYHLKNEPQNMNNGRNNLVGFLYRGFFAGTLTNSQYRRSYVIGFQRYWFTKPLAQDLTYQLGYRLGLIYGYDKRFGPLAERSPVLPFPQIIADFTWKKHLGWELSYTWVVVSTGFYIRF